ncbi:MAG: hypothetical protein P0Y59_14975 [Candidatus Sphingomonas phytovorans]|nr:hypothetical protein [Sphingomonas sp.]WEJ98245.1 MAG: hypothetical protein P0Y59_14975 [Sphingomonas sp.]
MADNYALRMLALSMAQIRQRMRDDLGIAGMVESGDLSIRMKKGSLFGRDASGDFGTDLRRRILEAQEFLERAAFAVTDEALVEAYEFTGGTGADADLLWREIRHRGLID